MSNDFDFANEFYKKVEDLQIDWNIKGLIAEDSRIYALGSDSKILGRVFEILAAPIIKMIADEHGYLFKIPTSQNTYPDFTLTETEESTKKIAIDVKTTYRKRSFNYTLGSFTSYLRNNTKNIHYPYNQYDEHYIIGFVYTRNDRAIEGDIVPIEDLNILDNPYNDVEFFVRRKKEITGEKKGSGNTDNIGSIKFSSSDEFHVKQGPFTDLPDFMYLHYWKNYPKYTESPKRYIDIPTYFLWLEANRDSIEDAEKLISYKPIYEKWMNNNYLI